ncbi:MAG TPA: FHA domain-containing protein [Pseudonocardia sp.]|uniref:FHA domain-containing protein n=1 Tax=Pseudonocardia sp. TaxID=60912 RepID=UPI002F41A0B7
MTGGHVVRLLPASAGSLAEGAPPSPPGTIYLLAAQGGISSTARDGFTLRFGRNADETHVCVGANDQHVSRRHGRFSCAGRTWTVHNDGQLPIAFPGPALLLRGERRELAEGYTPLFILGSHRREHLLEVRVTGRELPRVAVAKDQATERPRFWIIDPTERLVLACVGQRYLRNEPHPRPLSWNLVGQQLRAATGDPAWTAKRAEKVVERVRARLIRAGVSGLRRDEVGEPVGNTLNHNLVIELLLSTTLAPEDLRLLGDTDDW